MINIRTLFIATFIPLFFSGCFFPAEGPTIAIKYLESHSDMTPQQIRNFAWHGKIEQKRLLELANSPSYEVRRLVARNTNLPADHLQQMLNDHSWKVVLACTKNPNLTPDMRETLLHHKNYKIRAAMAADENLPLEDLITLTHDKSSIVRGQVAQNAKLPETEIRRMLQESGVEDPGWVTEERWVRAGIAANENVPMDILVILSKVKDPVVKSKVVNNPKTPEDILIELSQDKHESIRNEALRRLQAIEVLKQ